MSIKKYLPTKNDISEVCHGISKMLNAYLMTAQDIANGVILGTQTKYISSALKLEYLYMEIICNRHLMSLRDCVALSDHSMEMKDYNKSKEWLNVAISMLESSAYWDPIVPSADLYLKLAEVYVKQRKLVHL